VSGLYIHLFDSQKPCGLLKQSLGHFSATLWLGPFSRSYRFILLERCAPNEEFALPILLKITEILERIPHANRERTPADYAPGPAERGERSEEHGANRIEKERRNGEAPLGQR